MRKIDKSTLQIKATGYKEWVDGQDAAGKVHNKDYKYYDDVVMNLYHCQRGVCAYTEMRICQPEWYADDCWQKGRWVPGNADLKRTDHKGEMDHYHPEDKRQKYWDWDNLFMVDAKINGIKSNKPAAPFLKPDMPGYSPDLYFVYDDETHRYMPNDEIEDEAIKLEIQRMIDEVLYLNHGVVLADRRNYINNLKFRIQYGLPFEIDEFYTAVKIALGID